MGFGQRMVQVCLVLFVRFNAAKHGQLLDSGAEGKAASPSLVALLRFTPPRGLGVCCTATIPALATTGLCASHVNGTSIR
jgi:hypothetical protein